MAAINASSTALNPWRTIWWRPQATIKDILSRPTGSRVLLLASATGMCALLSVIASVNVDVVVAILAALLIGPLLGILQLYIDGALTAWTGRLLGGRASQRVLRTAIAWAWIPQMIAVPLLVGSMLVLGPELLREGPGPTDTGAAIVSMLLLVLSLWSFFLAIRTVGAVQEFGIVRSLANVLLPMLILLAAALFIRVFLFQPFNIPAGSMRPTLLIGDYFFANKYSYGYSQYSSPMGPKFAGRIFAAEPKRGDLVVFKLPRDNATDYVKRVIGLPGDEIVIKGGALFINGVEVPRRRVEDVVTRDDGKTQAFPAFEETLPNGVTYTVLDTLENGPFDNVGPYRVPQGHYFMMGDNRDNSTDSRAAWGVGYVPFENLVGRVSVIYLSVDAAAGPKGKGLAHAFDNVRWDRLLLVPH
jgi:signal peptidase I